MRSRTFYNALIKEIYQNIYNNFQEENHDAYRYGPYVKYSSENYLDMLLRKFKKYIGYKPELTNFDKLNYFINKYEFQIERFYLSICEEDKRLLTKLIAYKLLGPRKVKLPLNTKSYWEGISKIKEYSDPTNFLSPGFLDFILKKYNLRDIGIPIELYLSDSEVYTDFILEQYSYKDANGSEIVKVEEGDVVLDLGGCWGDTALYFSNLAKEKGKVFSFEFIPNNLSIFKKNMALNPNIDNISIVERPVLDRSDLTIYYSDNGPASEISFYKFNGYSGITQSISIDDFVSTNTLDRIDFLKMDIEGSEFLALQGAKKTINTYKPKLAIAIYHSLEDLSRIANWVLDLNIGYKIYLGHYKIFDEETILFAKV